MDINYSAYDKVAKLNWRQALVFIKKLQSPKIMKHNRATEVSVYLLYLMLAPLMLLVMIEDQRPLWTTYLYSVFAIILLISIIAWSIWMRVYKAKRQLSIERFVSDNKFKYQKDIKIPKGAYINNASIFKGGYHRIFKDKMASDFFEVGNYQNTVGVVGYGGYVNQWGYLYIKLKRKIPNLYMEPKKQNIFTDNQLNIGFTLDQELKLEGNFNEYFTLYCPVEYERDALYVITPNLMQLLIDNFSKYHIEIIDNKCYIYGKKFKLWDKKAMGNIMTLIDELSPKIDRQTKMYHDERVMNKSLDKVNRQGRRLFSRRVDIIAGVVVFIVIFILRNEDTRNYVWEFFVNLFN